MITFLWIAQSVIILGLGFVMAPTRCIVAAIFACMAYIYAMNNGVPEWRDWVGGDCYDIGALTYLALCWAANGTAA